MLGHTILGWLGLSFLAVSVTTCLWWADKKISKPDDEDWNNY